MSILLYYHLDFTGIYVFVSLACLRMMARSILLGELDLCLNIILFPIQLDAVSKLPGRRHYT